MNDKITRVAHKLTRVHVAISYKQYFNQYMRINSPFREIIENDKDIEIPTMDSTDEEFEKFYEAVAEHLLKPDLVNRIKIMVKKPQEKIPVNILRKLPMVDSILYFASNIVHKFSSELEARLKAKYRRL